LQAGTDQAAPVEGLPVGELEVLDGAVQAAEEVDPFTAELQAEVGAIGEDIGGGNAGAELEGVVAGLIGDAAQDRGFAGLDAIGVVASKGGSVQPSP